MDYNTALIRLKRLTAADQEPTLSDEILAELLLASKRKDKNGVAPSETDWIPTYDLSYAVAEGWATKAALVANEYTFSGDGQTFSRAQRFQHFTQQEQKYRSRAGVRSMLIEVEGWGSGYAVYPK